MPPREMSECRKARVLPEWHQIGACTELGIQHYSRNLLFYINHQASLYSFLSQPSALNYFYFFHAGTLSEILQK